MITANPQRGESILVIDDKEYILRFTFDALARLQAELGLSSLEQIVEASLRFGDLNSGVLQQFIFWGLRDHHSEVTLSDVTGWNLMPYFRTIASVGAAMGLALNGETAVPLVPAAEPSQNGTGKKLRSLLSNQG